MAIWELGSVYSVGRDEILRTIKNRKGAMVVMLDTCQSGASVDASVPTGSAVDMNRLVNELGDKTLTLCLGTGPPVLIRESGVGQRRLYQGDDRRAVRKSRSGKHRFY